MYSHVFINIIVTPCNKAFVICAVSIDTLHNVQLATKYLYVIWNDLTE